MNWTFLTEVETPFGAPTRPSSHLLVNLTAWRRSKHLEHALQEASSEEHLLITEEVTEESRISVKKHPD